MTSHQSFFMRTQNIVCTHSHNLLVKWNKQPIPSEMILVLTLSNRWILLKNAPPKPWHIIWKTNFRMKLYGIFKLLSCTCIWKLSSLKRANNVPNSSFGCSEYLTYSPLMLLPSYIFKARPCPWATPLSFPRPNFFLLICEASSIVVKDEASSPIIEADSVSLLYVLA